MLKITMTRRRYVILLLCLVAAIGIVVLLSLPSSPLQKTSQKKAAVEIKTTYKNPFDKKTQYVNPFEKYKNPFVTNR